VVDVTDEVGAWVEPAASRRQTPGWAWVLIVALLVALGAASAYLAAGISKSKPRPLTQNAAHLTASLDTLNQQVTTLNKLLATVISGDETFSDSLSAASPQLQAAIDGVQIKLATIDDTIRTIQPEVRAQAGDASADRLQTAQRTLTDRRADLSVQLAANLAAVKLSLQRSRHALQTEIDTLTHATSKSRRHLVHRINVLQTPTKSQSKQVARLERQVKSLTATRQQQASALQALRAQVKDQQQQIDRLLQLVPTPSSSATAGPG
jgi:chromosome segregation ATPase